MSFLNKEEHIVVEFNVHLKSLGQGMRLLRLMKQVGKALELGEEDIVMVVHREDGRTGEEKFLLKPIEFDDDTPLVYRG